MSWITIIWSMAAAACLTLGAVHLAIWWRERAALLNLLFAVAAILVAAFAGVVLKLMLAQTPAEYGALHRWAHWPVGLAMIALLGFVRLYFNAGRMWLLWVVIGLRLLVLLLNSLSPVSFNFSQITALREFELLGETVSVPVGIPTPWARIGEGSVLLGMAFVADAMIGLWRRGNARERRRAVMVGGSFLVFFGGSLLNAILVHTGLLPMPYFVSLFFVLIVLAMAYELGHDLLHASQLARQLKESEERIDLAINAANLGLWSWDLESDEVWATPIARQMFGLEQSERFDFKRFLQSLHPDDREPVTHAVARAMNGEGEYAADYRVVLPGRPAHWITARGRVEFDQQRKPKRIRGVSVDITERKRADEKFRQAVEASPSAIIMVDQQGKILLVNSLTEALFGYERGELLGQAVEVLVPERYRSLHPGHREGFFGRPQARLMGVGRELFARRKDGSQFPVEIGLNPIHTEEGVLILCTIVDITERRRVEAETEELRRDLAHSGRVTLLGQLASALAHQLSQPLGAILRNTEAAQVMLQQPGPDLEELRAIITDIHKDNDRAGDVISRLRSLLKRRNLDLQRVDLKSLIEEVVSLLRYGANERQVKLQVSVAPALMEVHGDRVHLQQVLLNLIINAIDAQDGSSANTRSVEIGASQTARLVEVSVSDNGPGIPEESLARIFEPFYSTKPNGMGMGLPICKTIIEAHQGRIWAENCAKGGAVFRFTLAVADHGGDQ